MTPFSFVTFSHRLLSSSRVEEQFSPGNFKTPTRPGRQSQAVGMFDSPLFFDSPATGDTRSRLEALQAQLADFNPTGLLDTPGAMTPMSTPRPVGAGLQMTPLFAKVDQVADVFQQVGDVIAFLLDHIDKLGETHSAVVKDLEATVALLREEAKGEGILQDTVEQIDVASLTARIREEITSEFKAELQAQGAELQEARAALEAVQGEVSGLDALRAKVAVYGDVDIAALQAKAARYEALQSEYAQLQDAQADLRDDARESRQSLESVRADFDDADTQLRAAKEVIAELQLKQAGLRQRLEATQQELELKTEALEERIGQLRSRLDGAGDERAALDEELRGLESELERVSARKDNAGQRLVKLGDSDNPAELMLQIEDEFAAAKAELEGRLAASERRETALNLEVKLLEEQAADDEAQVRLLTEEQLANNAKMQELQEQLADVTGERDDLQAKFDDLQANFQRASGLAQSKFESLQRAQFDAKTKEELAAVSQVDFEVAQAKLAEARAKLDSVKAEFKAKAKQQFGLMQRMYEEKLAQLTTQASRQARIANDYKERYEQVSGKYKLQKKEILSTADTARLRLQHVTGMLENAQKLGEQLPALRAFAAKIQGEEDREFQVILQGITDLLAGLTAPVEDVADARESHPASRQGSPLSTRQSVPSSPLARAMSSVRPTPLRSDLRRAALQQSAARGLDAASPQLEPFSARLARLAPSSSPRSGADHDGSFLSSASMPGSVDSPSQRPGPSQQEAADSPERAEEPASAIPVEPDLAADALTGLKIRSSSAVNARAMDLDFDDHEDLESGLAADKKRLVDAANGFTKQSQFDTFLSKLEEVGDNPVAFFALVKEYAPK
jgi:predicted  nucleic acid-binding Zn-ribbon protein